MSDQMNKQKKRKTIVTLCLAAALVVAGTFLVSASETAAVGMEPSQAAAYVLGEEAITMEVNYGYDNTAKGGRYTPVWIDLANSADQAFEGKIQILSMESDYEIYRYEYPVSIEAGSSVKEHVYIPLGNRADQLFVTLVNGNGQKVVEKRLKLNVSLDVSELFIGVLSDKPERLSYLNGIGVSYSMLKTKTFNLTKENFPQDEIGLDLVDVILITNYRIRDLSERQTTILMEWVKNGGILILGTGNRVDDTLGRFAPELLDDSYEFPTVMSVNMGLEYDTSGPLDSNIDIPCVDVSLRGGNVIFSDDQMPLLSSVSREKGIIAVAAYDFVDIEGFCRENPSYVDKLFTNLMGESRINRLAESVYSGNSNQYWSVKSMINTGNVDRLPEIPLYVMEIIIYILLVGPGLYIFLKQRDLREYYRMGVVVLSILFTGIIYLMGNKTRFEDTFYNYARFLDASDDVISESTFINIRTPYNKPYSVSLNPSYSVRPVTRSYYYEMMSSPTRFTGTEDYNIAINYGQDKTKISAQNVVAFEPKYFQLEKSEYNESKIGFTGEVKLFDGKISGTVTNSFGYPVENAALIMYGNMVMLGDMQPGETKRLDGLELICYPVGQSYVVAEAISGGNQYKKADIEDEYYLDALEKTNALIFYLNNYMTSYTSDARVMGFVKGEDNLNLTLDRDYEHDGLTVVTSSMPVNSYRDRMVSRSVLMKRPKIVSGQYDPDSNILYGIDPVVLEYSLGNDIEVDRIKLNMISDLFLSNEKYGYMTAFSGNMYFYNYNTGVFDLLDNQKTEYTASDLSPYLSPSNTLTVKYLYDNTSEYSWNILLPMINVIGEER
ncbi:hypothetical protein [Clostridium sp. chh4-2]|uniref:hypothetical protein n=1 Tax=Clostridium sp. chh4-2 TaxID=2067550 RepID=UPI0011AF8B82|nr:hypothetical protein [Clostridium sp. chh4-2]